MSPLVTRPSLPEPGTVAASMPLSTESLRTDGASGASAGGTLAVGAGAAGAGAGAAALAGAAGGFWGAPRRTVIDLPEQRTDGDGLSILGDDVAERAGGRRRNFDGHLVGFELNQWLIDPHALSGLLEPAADSGFGHGFAERRHANFCHGLFPSRVMAGVGPGH